MDMKYGLLILTFHMSMKYELHIWVWITYIAVHRASGLVFLISRDLKRENGSFRRKKKRQGEYTGARIWI